MNLLHLPRHFFIPDLNRFVDIEIPNLRGYDMHDMDDYEVKGALLARIESELDKGETQGESECELVALYHGLDDVHVRTREVGVNWRLAA